jgi:hypothetical protein
VLFTGKHEKAPPIVVVPVVFAKKESEQTQNKPTRSCYVRQGVNNQPSKKTGPPASHAPRPQVSVIKNGGEGERQSKMEAF